MQTYATKLWLLLHEASFAQPPSTASGIKPVCFIVSMPEVRGQKREEERPPPHDELEPNWWKCCERSAASTVTSASCLSFVCVVLQLMGVFPLADLSDVTRVDEPSASNALFFRRCIFAFTTLFRLWAPGDHSSHPSCDVLGRRSRHSWGWQVQDGQWSHCKDCTWGTSSDSESKWDATKTRARIVSCTHVRVCLCVCACVP